MKTIFPILLIFFIASVTQAQWDVFTNLDFEQEDDEMQSGLAGWKTKERVQVSPQFRPDEKTNTCLHIYGKYEKSKPGFAYQQHAVKVDDYVKVRVSADIKGEDIQNGNGGIYAYTKNGDKWLQYKNLDDQAITGTKDWHRVQLDIFVSPEATTLRIGGSLNGEGKLWVDNFNVEVIEHKDCETNTEFDSFMKECLHIIGTRSLYKHELDTIELLDRWKKMATCATEKKEIYETLYVILRSVDNHSFHVPPEEVVAWSNTTPEKEEGNFPMSTGHRIDEHYAYISMPHFGGGDSASITLFANRTQDLIESLDHEHIKGWIIDLRDNDGGNCWPMLAGIGPLLGTDVAGYFIEDEDYFGWSYVDGVSYADGGVQASVSREPYVLKNPHLKVAVLTGPITASSGEVVTVAFKNRPNTKSFGQHTGRYSTGNVNHSLSDGSMLFLAQSVYADRLKNQYLDGVPPDMVVEDDKDTKEDEVIEAAMTWLKQTCHQK